MTRECPNPRIERPAHIPAPPQRTWTPRPESCKLCDSPRVTLKTCPRGAPKLSVDGKLTPKRPRIGLDSPELSSNRRTATFVRAAPATERPHLAGKREEARYAATVQPSAISLKYNASSKRTEHTTFGWVAKAAGRPLLAQKRGAARYAVTTPTSAISLNYNASSSTATHRTRDLPA